eukprot:5130678-Alexandrium_andersonii.AAC.1
MFLARCPKCNPHSAKCPSVLPSASIHNPPFRNCEIASGARSLNCAGPGETSNRPPKLPRAAFCAARRGDSEFAQE